MFTASCQTNSKRSEEYNNLNFKELLVEIREQKISPSKAENEFKRIILELKNKYQPAAYDSLNMNLVFPLKRKNYKSVGGKGRGFYGRHFNLFDHNVTRSHPAHDIFIYDLNRDSKDDSENDYVDVLAVNKGLVIATESDWFEEDGYKGGNYVWLYDLASGGIWYYAHQRKVYVVENQLVEQGDKIGEVGRTGFNAKTNRSDTHLHLMYLKIDDNLNPKPIDHYPWLKKARTAYQATLPTHYPRKELSANRIVNKPPRLLKTAFNLELARKPFLN
jgi:murein DD-endopeptidase MepM/ murein hydrolase activator NlpD